MNQKRYLQLVFADDMIVISEDKTELSRVITRVEEWIREAGMSINVKKSEYLTNAAHQSPITMGRETIEPVARGQAIRYLGVWVDGKLDLETVQGESAIRGHQSDAE